MAGDLFGPAFSCRTRVNLLLVREPKLCPARDKTVPISAQLTIILARITRSAKELFHAQIDRAGKTHEKS